MSEFNAGPKPAPARRRTSWAAWLAVIAWMGVIFLLSAQPDLGLTPDRWWSDLFSWIAHFGEYAVLAALLWLALSRTPALAERATVIAFLGVTLYSISDEIHQAFVPNRVSDVRDVIVDVAGALVVLWLLAHRRKMRTMMQEPPVVD